MLGYLLGWLTLVTVTAAHHAVRVPVRRRRAPQSSLGALEVPSAYDAWYGKGNARRVMDPHKKFPEAAREAFQEGWDAGVEAAEDALEDLDVDDFPQAVQERFDRAFYNDLDYGSVCEEDRNEAFREGHDEGHDEGCKGEHCDNDDRVDCGEDRVRRALGVWHKARPAFVKAWNDGNCRQIVRQFYRLSWAHQRLVDDNAVDQLERNYKAQLARLSEELPRACIKLEKRGSREPLTAELLPVEAKTFFQGASRASRKRYKGLSRSRRAA